MAQLTIKEFDDLIIQLVEHHSLARFHERLLKANALVSRKRPPTAQALAAQLYQLSAGLRRDHPARYAVEILWQDMLSNRITEEHSKTLETLAERINSCLTERLEVVPEKSAELLAALGAYHQAVAALTDNEVAYLEMLLRTSSSVAQFLRERRNEIVQNNEEPTEKREEEGKSEE